MQHTAILYRLDANFLSDILLVISGISQLNVGNEKTGTLYIIMFEAPEKEWENAWKIGKPMMSLFVLDEEV